MTQTHDAPRTPWHLWLVGILAVLWNAIGAVDYLMTQTENPAYMSRFTPEQIEYFTSFPVWAVSAWAIAVWGSVLGSLLLLLRKRLAVPVFLVSLLGMIVSTLYSYVFSDGLEIMGGAGAQVFTVLIFMIAVFLLVYSRSMARKGLLS